MALVRSPFGSLAAHTPSGAQLFMPAAMGQGSALVVPLFDKLSKLPDPRKVRTQTDLILSRYPTHRYAFLS